MSYSRHFITTLKAAVTYNMNMQFYDHSGETRVTNISELCISSRRGDSGLFERKVELDERVQSVSVCRVQRMRGRRRGSVK